MNNTTAIYIGTAVMVFAALVIVWTAITISNFKRFSQKRDEHYMKRIDGVEDLVRNEFKIISNSLKKL